MARFMSMVVVFLLALVLRTDLAKAIDCMSVISNLFPCSNFLKNPNPAVPESVCCNAARNLIALGDVNDLCQCFQPVISSFLASKAQQLPGLCNLDGATSPQLAKCLAPSLDASGGLLSPLPLIPLPPLPLIPLPPLPLIPLPPLPFLPVPPLPFVPPIPSGSSVENQEQLKNELSSDDIGSDGILPPLPQLPLPPFPFIPLPPLPKLPLPPFQFMPLPPLGPLPPLPFVPPAENQE